MGCCNSQDPEARANALINQQNNKWLEQAANERKLLLLGTGASGKSTIFKQLKCIHGPGLAPGDREESIGVIRSNCVAGIIIIIRKAHELYTMDPQQYPKCKLDVEDEKISGAIQTILQHSSNAFDGVKDQDLTVLADLIKFLWNLPCVQATYEIRGTKYAFPENMEYFFGRVHEIMKPNYLPTDEDVFKVRIRTTGMIEYKFEMNNQIFKICDVGGQRNERKKWIHSFQDVTAVVFVAALNHYNALLFEDETRNAMHESIDLFDELMTSKWFRNTEMILFLNKEDLFKEDIKNGFPLSVCFYEGWRGNAPHWTGPDYKKKEDKKEDETHFNECYLEARQFIQETYIHCGDRNANDKNNKQIYIHITCATDRDNVQKVFWDVQNMIIRLNLNRGGLLSP